MAKPTKPTLTIMLSEMREAIGVEYLKKRPNFEKTSRRLKRLTGKEMTRFDYECLMKDIRSLEELLNDSSVDEKQFAVTRLVVNSWDGKRQTKATLVPRRDEKSHPLDELKPPEPRTLTASVNHTVGASHCKVLCIPDIHFGWRNDGGPFLTAIHDAVAVAVVLESVRVLQPEAIVLLGDVLDLPSWSKYPTGPELRGLVQPAIESAYDFLADLRNHCHGARIDWVAGNHDVRLDKVLSVNATETLSLKQANGGKQIVSLEHLLRLDELQIQFHGPYGSSIWIDGVRFTHGELIGSGGGASVAKVLQRQGNHSTVFGHIHRLELAYRRIWCASGQSQQTFAMSCGTLARIDNVVPGSMDSDWHQGFGILDMLGRPRIVEIVNGACHVDGKTIAVELDVELDV